MDSDKFLHGNLKGQIGVGFIWILFGFFLTTIICAYLVYAILPLFPPTGNIPAEQALVGLNTYVKYTFSFIDNSFYVLIVIVLLIGLYASYSSPSKAAAIVDLFGIFFLSYFILAINAILPSLAVFTPAVNLQLTYTFFNSVYKGFILYFVMIVSIILNLRGKS